MAIKGDLFMDVIDFGYNLSDIRAVSKQLKSNYLANPVYLGMAFSDNPIIHDDINKAYDSVYNIVEYMNEYASEMTYDAISSFNIERQDIIYKTCALFYYCFSLDDFTIMNKIIKKGYKRLYRHLENAKGTLDTEVDIVQAHKIEHSTLNDLKVYSFEIVAAYYCYFNNKEFLLTTNSLYSWSMHIIQSLIVNKRELKNIKARKDVPFDMNTLMSPIFRQHEKPKYASCDKNDKKYSKESIDELYKKYGVSKTYLTVDMIMADYRHQNMVEKYGKDCEVLFNYMELVAKEDVSDEILITYDFMLGCLRLAGLYPLAFMVQPLEREEITLCLLGLEDFRLQHDMTVEETKKLLPHMLIMFCLGKQYRKASKVSIIDDLENKAFEINELRKEYQEKVNTIDEKAHRFESKANHLEKRLKDTESELLKRISELEKQNSELKKDLEDYQSIKKEVVGLRDKVYKDSVRKEDEECSIESMTSYINDRAITIIGGNPQWVGKLSKELPNIKFIEFKSINNSINTIKKLDRVYLNVEYFNHPMYYKLMNSLSDCKTKVVYLSGYTNTQRTIKEIYDYEVE